MMKKIALGCALVVLLFIVAVAVIVGWLVWRRSPGTAITLRDKDGTLRRAELERGWSWQPSGTEVALLGICVAAPPRAVVGGERSVILRLDEDGGWAKVRGEEERGHDFRPMGLDAEGRCWAVSRGQLLRTGDGGRSWLPVSKPTNYHFGPSIATGTLYFQMDAPTCSATVHLTEDFGATWHPLATSLPENDFSTVFFLDRDRGWVGKGRGGMARTEDGGKTWIRHDVPASEDIAKIQFVTPEEGWMMAAIGHHGGVRHSVDGGQTWHLQDLGVAPGHFLKDMQFLDQTTGFVAAEHEDATARVYRTLDGGRSWQLLGTLPVPINAIGFLDARTGWAVGAGGFIFRYDEP
jgi:photosystem II stability/assembly factor-like uncharacterized protein